MDGRTHARTRVTLNAPPPFFKWRGHNKLEVPASITSDRTCICAKT